MPDAARTDVLGHPYTAETLSLGDDPEGAVVATLVRRPADGNPIGAVLHVHGFADYFFQKPYAEWWTERGYDFYALDLRKYGRSLLPHQTANHALDLAEYFEELDLAWQLITERDEHRQVILSGHSTGGLTGPLWVAERRGRLAQLIGLVLNSPWFDLQGPAALRSGAAGVLVRQLAARRPMQEIPRKVSGLYARSLHSAHEGEFDFDLAWKPLESWPVRVGWLSAVRSGQARLHAGLEIDEPILVLSSERSGHPTTMTDPAVHRTDIVLDVEQIRARASGVGHHVTSIAVPSARHDVFLSLPEVRAHAFELLGRWHDAWLG